MPTPSGHLARALRGLTVDAVRAQRARTSLDRTMGANELDLQYQVDVSGQADSYVALTVVEIDFEVDFYYAPGNRDSDLQRPHMTCGGEADSQVILGATVVAWHDNALTGAIQGADVAVSVHAPSLTDFKGKVHLNFQGWGMVRDTGESATAQG